VLPFAANLRRLILSFHVSRFVWRRHVAGGQAAHAAPPWKSPNLRERREYQRRPMCQAPLPDLQRATAQIISHRSAAVLGRSIIPCSRRVAAPEDGRTPISVPFHPPKLVPSMCLMIRGAAHPERRTLAR
jgi:hypothetical protein